MHHPFRLPQPDKRDGYIQPASFAKNLKNPRFDS
jgi:hypothetical protein